LFHEIPPGNEILAWRIQVECYRMPEFVSSAEVSVTVSDRF